MKSVIAEILRTGVRHVPLLLRVERVIVQGGKAVSAEGSTGRRRRRSNTIHRLYLTDDELIVQALLLPELDLEVNEGDQLQIHKYAVRKAARKEQTGHVVFFGIEDCDNLTRLRPDTAAAVEEEGGFIREPGSATFTSAQPSTRKRSASSVSSEDFENTLLPPSKQPRLESSLDIPSDDEMSTPGATQESEDDFEAFTPNANITQHRRQALRELDPNRSFYFDAVTFTKPKPSSTPAPAAKQPQPTAGKSPASKLTTADRAGSTTKAPASIPIPSPSPPTPLNALEITPLSALPSLDPSSPTTILGIITWTSPNLLRPSPAFPPKRHVKIHDISIGHLFSGVSLAVYIDAATFKPQRGTVALLQDVVVQRCGSGSGEVNECFMLNAYANLPAKLAEKQKKGMNGDGDGGGGGSSGDGKWFIDDEDQLLALGLEAEVDELRTWWNEREAKRAGTAARSTQIATTRTESTFVGV
ncbi:uncharacterized protein AB675_11657 [Cyphellophora attinorum]|uniref:Uncharacterized protein n=1 Tax=Cyphellophora attinorum TaxID=1664694 RepID=A0A0N1HHR5_9EURO|nr:uncharacterized protein AB675_11657 [Phialophora attinorum]KPI35414.1 hypothetical protein AB675_11657 [Phialophora attinorum]